MRVRNLIWMILIPALSLCFADAAFAQEKKEKLEEKKKKIEQDIRYTNRLIKETAKSRKSSLNELSLIESSINSRQQLINTIDSEVDYLKEEISSKQREIDRRNKELEILKEEYAKMIYHAYKTQSRYHKLMFVFSSEDFNQAYRRLKYLRQYGDFRKEQAQKINEKKKELNQKIARLKENKEQKVELMARKQREKQKLKDEKQGKDEVISSLSEKEQKLKQKLQRKRAKAKELEKEIERIIAREMAKAKKSAGKSKEASPKFKLTPEQVELSENFTSNKGKLPWPTRRGIVSSSFGRHAHPKLRGVVEYNNGITIQTSENAQALAVFRGSVKKVISIANKKAVLIQHGDYFTLYDNLKTVNVGPGDVVETGQSIGTIKKDNDNGFTQINFQIWQARQNKRPEKLNPSAWLLSRS